MNRTPRTPRTFRNDQDRPPLPAVLFAAIAAAVIAGCAGGTDGASPTDAEIAEIAEIGRAGEAAGAGHEAGAEHEHGETLAVVSDYSIYHLAAPWTDQHGEERPLASLAGRVQVMAMVYTTCAHACPRILADMKRIEASLPEAARDHVGFVLVTIDPDRDTPEQLASFASAVGLDPQRWTLLTAPDTTVLELAAILGVQYRRISEADFSHTNVITVLDQQGEVSHRQVGLGTEPDATLEQINRLLSS